MEFPQLGQHCSAKGCNKLDFLPMKCDACSAILCKDHIKYDEHQCSSSYRKNVQIPVCPLCNQHVPYEYRDQSPDRAVSAHIDRDCRSRKREKVYANKCSVASCKQREAIPVNYFQHQSPAKQKKQEEDDYALAKALQESERQELQRIRRNQTTSTAATANTSTSSTDNRSCCVQ
ncbi:unnamed protein product [Adineta ricciae]|uniref:AN1-type domain-containing protein n=1 Tax=Adineta ricciae TaxID=249248 RepID=A0A814LJ04_ADIRI|nr:unnamed protein product [Adineta ricciae]